MVFRGLFATWPSLSVRDRLLGPLGPQPRWGWGDGATMATPELPSGVQRCATPKMWDAHFDVQLLRWICWTFTRRHEAEIKPESPLVNVQF